MDIKRIFWILLVCCCGMMAVGQTYRVGDVYTAPDGSQGIVYYLHPDGSGGWVVALNDASEGCLWGENYNIPDLQDHDYDYRQLLMNDTAGYTNTQIIRAYQNNSPQFAAGQVDFENGWYLPAPAQLRMLYARLPFIRSALESAGGTDMGNAAYWTSAERNEYFAWCVSFMEGTSGFFIHNIKNTYYFRVRAVRSFTYTPTYVWSTGDTAVSITVAPEQTTDYTVSVSNLVVCSGEATQTILVNPLDTTPVVVTECENYTWNGVTYDTSGVITEHYLNANGCDSVVILYLTINNPIHQSITATGIEGYEWHDSVYTQDGDYLYSHLDANGCMQVDTLHLTIYHGTTTQFDTTVCESDLPIEWGGVVFTTAGTHIDSLETFEGADSLVFWNVHVVELPVLAHSPDTAVLAGDSLTLWAAGSEILTWTDGNGALVGNGATISIRPLTSGYYYVTGYSSGEMVNNNLLENGDFEQGNTGFITDYLFVDSLHSNALGAGNYTITDDAHHVWSSRHQYGYGGSGLFLIADGASQSNKKVWSQTVEVQPNTDYVLLAHFLSVGDFHLSTADLLFNVNGTQLGPVVHLMDNPSQWQDYAAVWKNTSASTANISLVDTNLAHPGNDFGVDDLRLTPILYCSVTDSIWVEVLPNPDTMLLTDSVCAYYVWYGDTLTQSDVYYHTMTNQLGYDSVEVLTLTVFPTSTFDTFAIACDQFTWRDSIYTESGVVVSYLTNAVGCDSVVTLHLTITNTDYTDYTDEVCDSLRWIDGNLYTESTDGPTFTLTNAAGCDSVVTLHLTITNTDHTDYTDDVCDSLRWIDGNLYTESTDGPTFTLTNAAGCDSVVTLHLTVRHSTTYIDEYDVCDSLRWIDGNLYVESTNEPTYTLPNAAGCDSIVTLNLIVRHSTTYVDVQQACDSMRWIDGNLYTESTDTPTVILPNAVGCDSLVILHLTITNTDYTDYTDEVCDSLRWIDGNLYTESTDGPTFTLTNAVGCDSVVTLHLTITNTDYTDYTDDVCDSLRWIDGNLYTESTNEPTFTVMNAAGCDSVVTLHLTVRHSTNTTINAEIVQNNLPYVLNDSTYTATGTYYQHFTNAAGCDSTVTLHLTVYNNTTAQVYAMVCASALPYTWSGHVFAEAGTFTDTLLTTHGADSVVTYTLTVDNISATIGNVDHIVCYGDSTGFATATVTGGQPPMTCAWTNTANITLSTTTTLIDVPAGFYTFTVTDVIGCTAVDTVTIISLFGEVDPGTISADQVVCVGEQPAPFTGTAATGSDHIIYFWEFSSDGEIWSTAQGDYNTQNYTYPYPAPFSFYLHRLSIIQGCGIYYSNVVTVSVWPNSMDTVMAAVCQNEPYEGFGFDITADQTAAPGDYTFEQHHATGHCDSVVVLILTVNPLFETEVEDVVCEGEGYDDNGFSIAPLETVGEEQLTRMLTLQSAAGCDSVVTLHLSVIDTAVRIVSLTPDFCEDLSAELMVVTDMPNYVWSTGETAPTITVTHSGRYYVTATSGECSSTAQFTVENCDGDQILLPNAITPSRGDGLNDYFSIPERNLRSINLFEIWIYNRWGELVYYSNDKNFRWNGEYRGQTQYQTVYNYVIRYTDAAGKPYFVKGSVTVL
jgi:gliding motility-associated-like protein